MGLIYAHFQLRNPLQAPPAGTALEVRALVDTGALMLCVPASVASQLGLRELERREVTLADGGKHSVPYVGPVQLSFGNRSCFVGAFVLGQQVLVGAIPLEDMDLVIAPATRKVVVNPLSPDIPSGIVMSAARLNAAGSAWSAASARAPVASPLRRISPTPCPTASRPRPAAQGVTPR